MSASNDKLLNFVSEEEKLREHAKTLLAQVTVLQRQLDDVVADRDRLVGAVSCAAPRLWACGLLACFTISRMACRPRNERYRC
jgi:hypothetical protein